MNNKGFTLVELLTTILIIGLLTTLAMTGVRIAQTKARVAKAQHEVDTIYRAMGVLANDTELWPGGQAFETVCTDLPGGCPAGNEICGDGCTFSLSDPESGLLSTDGSFPGWSGPYMAQMPVDSWGNEYFFDTDYEVTAGKEPCNGGAMCVNVAVVGSYGPDGLGNNQYNADDIIKIVAY